MKVQFTETMRQTITKNAPNFELFPEKKRKNRKRNIYHPRVLVIRKKRRFDMSRRRSSHGINPRIHSWGAVDFKILEQLLLGDGEVSPRNRRWFGRRLRGNRRLYRHVGISSHHHILIRHSSPKTPKRYDFYSLEQSKLQTHLPRSKI